MKMNKESDILMPSGFNGSKVIEEDSFCSSLKEMSRIADNETQKAAATICKNPPILEKISSSSDI